LGNAGHAVKSGAVATLPHFAPSSDAFSSVFNFLSGWRSTPGTIPASASRPRISRTSDPTPRIWTVRRRIRVMLGSRTSNRGEVLPIASCAVLGRKAWLISSTWPHLIMRCHCGVSWNGQPSKARFRTELMRSGVNLRRARRSTHAGPSAARIGASPRLATGGRRFSTLNGPFCNRIHFLLNFVDLAHCTVGLLGGRQCHNERSGTAI